MFKVFKIYMISLIEECQIDFASLSSPVKKGHFTKLTPFSPFFRQIVLSETRQAAQFFLFLRQLRLHFVFYCLLFIFVAIRIPP